MRSVKISLASCCLLLIFHTFSFCLDFPYLLPDDLNSFKPIVSYTDNKNLVFEVPWPRGITENGMKRATQEDLWTKVLRIPSLKDSEYRKKAYANVLLTIATMPIINEQKIATLNQVLDEVDQQVGPTLDQQLEPALAVASKVALAIEVLAESNLKYVKGTTRWTELINKVKQDRRYARLLTRGTNWKDAKDALLGIKAGMTIANIVTRTVMINALATDGNTDRLVVMEKYFRENPSFRLKDHNLVMEAFVMAKEQLSANKKWWNAFATAVEETKAERQKLGVDIAMHILAKEAATAAGAKAGVVVSLWAIPVALGVAEYHELVKTMASVHHALLAGAVCQKLRDIPTMPVGNLSAEQLSDFQAEISLLNENARYLQYEFYNQMHESLTGWLSELASWFFKDIEEMQKHYRNRKELAFDVLVTPTVIPMESKPLVPSKADIALIIDNSDISENVLAGSMITISITIRSASSIYSGKMMLVYNPAVLTPTTVSKTKLTTEALLEYNITPPQLQISLASAKPIQANGSLADITFQVSRYVPVGTTTQISFLSARFDEGNISASTKPKTLTVVEPSLKPIILIPNIVAQQGESIVVPIEATNAQQILSGNIGIRYDPSLLTFKEVVKTDLTQKAIVESHQEGNEIRIAFASGTPIIGSGTLLNLSFIIASNAKAGARSELAFSFLKLDQGSTIPVTTNGAIIVKGIDIPTLKVSDVIGTAGSSITVPLNLEKAKNIFAGKLTIVYDSGILTATNVSAGAIAPDMMVSQSFSTDKIVIAFASAVPINGNGVLINIGFKVLDKAPKEYKAVIALNEAQFNESSILPITVPGSFLVTEGKIEVQAPKNLDLTNDNKVDISDLAIVIKNFGQEVKGQPEANPDVNGDGVVDIFDLVLIAKHFGKGQP